MHHTVQRALNVLATIGLTAGTVMAQSRQQSPTGGLASFLPMMLLMFIIIYFLMFRPEQKKQKERAAMIANLKKGDKVLTNSGMYGTVGNVKDNSVMVKIAENTVVEFAKSAVSTVINPDAPKSEGNDTGKEKK